jgi:hypothetical protein
MPRAETSRKNLEKARERLRETIAAGRAAKQEDDASDGVFDADAEPEPESAPVAKKAKKAAPAKAEDLSVSSDDEEEERAKPAVSVSRKRKADALAALVKEEMQKHFGVLRTDVTKAVAHGQMQRDIQKFLQR